MSNLSRREQDRPAPDDLAYYAPGGLRERAKSQYSLSQKARSELGGSPMSSLASPGIELKNVASDASWKRLAPEVIDEPPGLAWRDLLFSVAGRFAAAVGVLMIVGLFFVIMLPALRQLNAGSSSSEITGSITTAGTQSGQRDNGSKPALAEFGNLLASVPATHEQSPQLVQQFLQWRQKADSTGTSR